MLITDDYRKLNEKLHATNAAYGTSGNKWAKHVLDLSKVVGSTDVLDYGCGKSTLPQNLPFSIKQYDPAVAKYAAAPNPADIVICTDVLEHIEPECVKDVLMDICRLTKELAFLCIAAGPAKKFLADGRNAHLIQENDLWWLGHILPLFHLLQFNTTTFSLETKSNNVLEYMLTVSPRIQL